MNRIILIGNGFDLAHNLRTKYCHFIDKFWENISKDFENRQQTSFDNEFLSINANFSYSENYSNYKLFKDRLKISNTQIKFKNRFLEIISERSSLNNWVDIEEEYFQQARDIIQNKSQYYSDDKDKKAIENLNEDFDKIKQELDKYLQDESIKKILINKSLKEIIYSNFNKKDFTEKGINGLVEDVYQAHVVDCTLGSKLSYTEDARHNNDDSFRASYLDDRDYINKEIREGKMDLMPLKNILFLNFNYTKTEMGYSEGEDILTQTIHIHGELNNPNSPIIFGYGDEQDERHKEIEKQGGDYLNNIKTINYLKTSNYKNLLSFIEGGQYQVFIMGHSCGLSDKTLLSTLFEHENCVSIKPFFHKWKDDDGIEHDDYEDKIKNIYRVFTNKTLMREKVVNKEWCKAFPISNKVRIGWC